MALPINTPANEVVISPRGLADVGTAGSTYTVCPVKGRLARGYSVIGGAITGSDSTWSVLKNAVAVTGTCTVAVSGSAAGVTDEVFFTGSNTGVNVGDTLQISNGGESTGTATVDFMLVIRT